MRFEDFARERGLIINSLIPDRWIAVPTEDHPHKRNGRYKLLGDIGWVQNWATMTAPDVWKSEGGAAFPTSLRIAQKRDQYQRHEAAKKAISKAGWILHQCQIACHPYLKAKGFPVEEGNVWVTPENNLLVVPMRRDNSLVGAQLIDEQGGKKFLQGQQSKGAAFIIDAGGVPIFCEGFATGLSIRAAMKAMKVRYKIYICFSASNMQEIALGVEGGFVVADKDPHAVGEVAARNTHKPYWLSDTTGEDFNDYHMRVGLFKATSSLKAALFARNTLPKPEGI
jgi:putative DNA primase/helicase